MGTADVNGITISYDEHGEGEPLLLIMGLGAQLVSWPLDWVNRFVDRGFRVIRLDNRDIGLSTKFDDAGRPALTRLAGVLVSQRFAEAPYHLSDMADDAAGLLDHLGLDRAHVVGASMGGMIAQCLAIQHPKKVASLTSIMSNTGDRRHGRPSVPLLTRLAAVTRSAARSHADSVRSTVATLKLISGPHWAEAEAEVRAIAEEQADRHLDGDGVMRELSAIAASPDRTEDLRWLAVPTLVIHGLLDRLVAWSGGVATAEAIPNSRLLMFPDMAHDLPIPRRAEMVEAIIANCARGGFPA